MYASHRSGAAVCASAGYYKIRMLGNKFPKVALNSSRRFNQICFIYRRGVKNTPFGVLRFGRRISILWVVSHGCRHAQQLQRSGTLALRRHSMKQVRIALFIALVLAVASVGVAGAQSAYQTTFTTSITFQNVGTQPATIQFQFYNQGSSTPVVVTRPLAAGAGSSLFVGGLQGNEALPQASWARRLQAPTSPSLPPWCRFPTTPTSKCARSPMALAAPPLRFCWPPC